jgi:hypothetical protein
MLLISLICHFQRKVFCDMKIRTHLGIKLLDTLKIRLCKRNRRKIAVSQAMARFSY